MNPELRPAGVARTAKPRAGWFSNAAIGMATWQAAPPGVGERTCWSMSRRAKIASIRGVADPPACESPAVPQSAGTLCLVAGGGAADGNRAK